MYFGGGGRVEGRYLEDVEGFGEFSPVGPVFFRPAGLHLKIRGATQHAPDERRAVHCLLDDRRLQALDPSGLAWGHAGLRAALDLKANDIRSYFLRLHTELMSPSFASSLVVDALLVLLVSDLHKYLLPLIERREGKAALRDQLIERIRERVYDHSLMTPTVAELAALSGTSERQLLRLFRESQGVSIVEFVRRAKIEKAMDMLSASKFPLKEIAYRLGFSSHASFTTAFTRETGATPKEFRRERRRTYGQVAQRSGSRLSIARGDRSLMNWPASVAG